MLPLLLLMFTFTFADCSGLSVYLTSNGTIKSINETVKLQTITFTKLSMNKAIPTSIEFFMNNTAEVDNLGLKWFFEDKQLSVASSSENSDIYTNITILSDHVLIVLNLKDNALSPGAYKLEVTLGDQTGEATGFVTSDAILPVFPKDRRVLEGDRMLISCDVTGYPKPSQVNWRFAHIKPEAMRDTEALPEAQQNLVPLEENAGDFEFMTKAVTNDQLLFPQLSDKRNGLFECSVDSDRSLIVVNVKDRWAALWPFIGIVIEVAVLVTAILLYERHQMRSKSSKVDANAGNTTAVTTEPSSPGVKPKTSVSSQQQQQNNVVADPQVELAGDGPKGTDIADARADDVRLRGTARC